MKKKLVTAPLVMLLLSSCVSQAPAIKADIALPANYAEGTAKKSNEVVVEKPWWNDFRDRRLTAYVGQGLDQNLDIKQAVERIEQARANAVIAGAGDLPQVNGSADAGLSGEKGSLRTTSGTTKQIGAGLGISWLIDIFGQYRSARESAAASLDAAYASADVARLTLLSELVTAYIDTRYYQEAVAVSNKALASRRETLRLIRASEEAGASTRLEVVQAEGLVNTTLADLPALESGFRSSAHRVATLLGIPAATLVAELQKGAAQPVARFSVSAGVPADLIRNRPDIRAAERQLAAAVADIGVAEAQLYPSLSLAGDIDVSRAVTSAVAGSLTSWSFGPSLSIPIFNGGRLKANVDLANSAAREQYLAWRNTVLEAVEDVENALIAYRKDRETVAALRKVVESYQTALELSRTSYQSGAASVLDVLDAERSLATANLSLASAIRQMANDYVVLNVAIGGGYAAQVSGGKS